MKNFKNINSVIRFFNDDSLLIEICTSDYEIIIKALNISEFYLYYRGLGTASINGFSYDNTTKIIRVNLI